MGLVDDILQGLPVNSLLREQVSQLNAQKAAVDEQNAILSDDNRELKAEIAKLKKQVEELTHNPDLDETDILLLKEIALAQHGEPTAAQFAKNLGLNLILVEHHLYRLIDLKYASAWSLGGGDRYQLEQKGREYAIKNNLLS